MIPQIIVLIAITGSFFLLGCFYLNKRLNVFVRQNQAFYEAIREFVEKEDERFFEMRVLLDNVKSQHSKKDKKLTTP